MFEKLFDLVVRLFTLKSKNAFVAGVHATIGNQLLAVGVFWIAGIAEYSDATGIFECGNLMIAACMVLVGGILVNASAHYIAE